MTSLRAQVFAGAIGLVLVAASTAAADQILVASVTCINPNGAASCTELGSGQVWWRVVNWMGQFDSPFEGSNDLKDVSLQFVYEGGSSTTRWDVIPPAAPGVFGETAPFDASLVNRLISIQLTGTLSRTVFDPLYPSAGSPGFIADSARVSATATQFPPPMDVFAVGSYVAAPVPEPGTLALCGLGLAALATSRRRRRRGEWRITA